MTLGVVAARPAAAMSEQEQLVERARLTVLSLKNFNDVGVIRPYVQGARAVVVIPSFIKASLVIGGAHGEGVMVGRNLATGAWRYPAFVSLSEGSIGLQAGAEASEIIMIVLTEKGVNALLTDKVKLGGEAGIAVLNIGAGREASTTTNMGADVVTFARSKGLYAGLSLEGAVLSLDNKANSAYHGKPLTARQLVQEDIQGNAQSDDLREALANF
jgi:lipid-binding SYLF domain-containing protein